MKFTVKVEITPQDIENGVPGHSWYCPVAWALRRALGDCGLAFKYAGVGYDRVWIIRPGASDLGGPLPAFMQAWIRDWDTDCRGAPIKFEIELETGT